MISHAHLPSNCPQHARITAFRSTLCKSRKVGRSQGVARFLLSHRGQPRRCPHSPRSAAVGSSGEDRAQTLSPRPKNVVVPPKACLGSLPYSHSQHVQAAPHPSQPSSGGSIPRAPSAVPEAAAPQTVPAGAGAKPPKKCSSPQKCSSPGTEPTLLPRAARSAVHAFTSGAQNGTGINFL